MLLYTSLPALRSLPLLQILALREENELLMDQLVTTKVRLAETEGDFLRSKRELLRAKEKRQEVRGGAGRSGGGHVGWWRGQDRAER